MPQKPGRGPWRRAESRRGPAGAERGLSVMCSGGALPSESRGGAPNRVAGEGRRPPRVRCRNVGGRGGCRPCGGGARGSDKAGQGGGTGALTASDGRGTVLWGGGRLGGHGGEIGRDWEEGRGGRGGGVGSWGLGAGRRISLGVLEIRNSRSNGGGGGWGGPEDLLADGEGAEDLGGGEGRVEEEADVGRPRPRPCTHARTHARTHAHTRTTHTVSIPRRFQVHESRASANPHPPPWRGEGAMAGPTSPRGTVSRRGQGSDSSSPSVEIRARQVHRFPRARAERRVQPRLAPCAMKDTELEKLQNRLQVIPGATRPTPPRPLRVAALPTAPAAGPAGAGGGDGRGEGPRLDRVVVDPT